MIGPGWMPSRPRPLGRMRRGLQSSTSSYLRKRPRRRRPELASQPVRDVPALECNTEVMLFDGSPAALPTARVRPSTPQARHRMISGHIQQWLAQRWSWLRPRTVPMIVAFVGMLGVLGATKYLPAWSYVDQPAPRALRCVHEPAIAGAPAASHGRSPRVVHRAPPRQVQGTAVTVDTVDDQ
jgi:hypothetical protein